MRMVVILCLAACGQDADSSSSPICVAYLDCLEQAAQNSPQLQATLDQARSQYGNCAGACEDACKQGLASAGQAYPSVAACHGGSMMTTGGSESCDRYLACLSTAAPSGYGAALQLYGPQSACWQNPMTSDGCTRACSAGLAEYVKQGRCSCASNTDCPAAHPLCENGACGGCGSDADCAPSLCDSGTHQCIGCRSNSDCSGRQPHCDLPAHACVGCQSDADCEHHCNVASGLCVDCVDDSQCDPDQYCYWDNRCVGRASAAPSQLTCARCNGTSICLTWKDNSNDENGFEIHNKVGTMDYTLGRTAADVTSYEVKFVAQTLSYTLYVYSCNAAAGCLYATGYCTVQ